MSTAQQQTNTSGARTLYHRLLDALAGAPWLTDEQRDLFAGRLLGARGDAAALARLAFDLERFRLHASGELARRPAWAGGHPAHACERCGSDRDLVWSPGLLAWRCRAHPAPDLENLRALGGAERRAA